MSWVISVLGAQHLQFSEDDLEIAPKVEVIGRGVGLTLIGSTPCSVFRHPTLQNPIWETSLPCDFFRCHTLEFVVYHYRPIGFNKRVGTARISLRLICPGKPTTIPLQMEFTCHRQPTITFSALPQWTPFPMGAVKFAHKRIFVYTTYSPPIEGASETLPVSFKCVSVDTIELRFSVLDETVPWESIGKGCLGAIFPGPTGDTYVAMLNRKKLARAITTFIICSHNYTGNVSLNFVLAETNYHTEIYRAHPTNEVIRLLSEIVVHVEPQSVTTIPHLFPAKKYDVLFAPLEPIVLTPDLTPSDYETRIANAISPGPPCVRRLMQPLHTDGIVW
jgi:hypothetical protein